MREAKHRSCKTSMLRCRQSVTVALWDDFSSKPLGEVCEYVSISDN